MWTSQLDFAQSILRSNGPGFFRSGETDGQIKPRSNDSEPE